MLADALAVAAAETGCDASPVDAAIDVESEVYSQAGGTNAAYTAKVGGAGAERAWRGGGAV